ncbi:hypothetical protein ACNS7O_06855 [Haloferacaceae archaeon DSL9]
MTNPRPALSFEWEGESIEYAVDLRFTAAGELPSVDEDGRTRFDDDTDPDTSGDETWRIVAINRADSMLRFADKEWYGAEQVADYLDENVLSFDADSRSDAAAAPTLTDAETTYRFEPGLKFVADASFVQSNRSGSNSEPVELVVVDLDDGDVSVAERSEDGYRLTDRVMSYSTFERGIELSQLDCVGLAPVEERTVVADAVPN